MMSGIFYLIYPVQTPTELKGKMDYFKMVQFPNQIQPHKVV